MEPGEYRQLEEIARQQQVSVAELIRSAVRQRYLTTAKKPAELVEEILSMNLPVDDWEQIEQEIEQARGAGLP